MNLIPIMNRILFFNGVASNVKGWFVEFMESLLGLLIISFGATNHSSLEGRISEEIHTCVRSKKRGVFFSELKRTRSSIPHPSTRTDMPKVKARPLYKDFIDVYFCGLKVLECNGKPPMKGRADYAILRRVIDLHFESMFTNEKEDVDEENNVYLKKAEYK